MAVYDLDHDFRSPVWSSHWDQVKKQGSTIIETHHRAKDGRMIPVEIAVSHRKINGKEYHFSFARDITERKQMEVQLRQQQKLAAIGTLASGAAHEINNPIMGMMNYAQLILDRPDQTSSIQEYAGEIIREGDRVAKIIRSMLSFAKQQSHAHSPAHVTDIVNGVLPMIEASLRVDQIALTLDFPAVLPNIRCHTQQIQQVLMALFTNARETLNHRYPGSDENKTIILTGSTIERDGKRLVRLTMEDHGAGIAPEIVERIFDPFFTTKSRSEHSGLGLFTSQNILRTHGGQLMVEDEPGKYTRVHLDLPAVPADAQ
jgi:signal transduction histidine kinase